MMTSFPLSSVNVSSTWLYIFRCIYVDLAGGVVFSLGFILVFCTTKLCYMDIDDFMQCAIYRS